MESTRGSWRAGDSILVQLEFADLVLRMRRIVREGSKLAVEFLRAAAGSVLKRYPGRAKCLIENMESKFAGPALSPHAKCVLASPGFGFETYVLDVDLIAHLLLTNHFDLVVTVLDHAGLSFLSTAGLRFFLNPVASVF